MFKLKVLYHNVNYVRDNTIIKYYLQLSCILEFDGAASGNPGPAGAGAILRSEDGSLVSTLCNNSFRHYIILFIYKM